MNNVEYLINFLITIFGAGGVGLLLIRRGMDMFEKRLDANNTAQAMQLQIALKDKEADIAAGQAGQNNFNSMVQLLQTTMQQMPLLITRIGELTERLDSNQRQVNSTTESILTAYRRDVDRIDVGFRTINDSHIFQNSAINRVISKIDESMDVIRNQVMAIRNDVSANQFAAVQEQGNLEEIVELVIEMRNTVAAFTGHDPIRPVNDTGPFRPPPPELLKTSMAATQRLPELEGVDFVDDVPQTATEKPLTTDVTTDKEATIVNEETKP